MSLSVTLRGKKYDVAGVESVADVQRSIEEQAGLSAAQQAVLYDGKMLSADAKLADVGLSFYALFLLGHATLLLLEAPAGLRLEPLHLGQLGRVHVEPRLDQVEQRRRRRRLEGGDERTLLVDEDDEIGEGALRERRQRGERRGVPGVQPGQVRRRRGQRGV